MVIERHFDEELQELKGILLRMGSVSEEMIRRSMKCLMERADEEAEQVFELEKTVNQLHIDVDELCIRLMALHQPMAVDLRLLTAAMKINSDLERIADQAVNMAQTAHFHLLKETPVPQTNMLPHMAEIAQKMLTDSLDAFAKRDVELARTVMKLEEEEDRLKFEAINNLIDMIRRDPVHSKQLVDIILISKNIERIGDHATNIAEDVIFMVLGKDIRHRRDDEPARTEAQQP